MPILENAKKALRVSKRKAEINQPVRSRLKTAVDASKKNSTPENMSSAFSAIDKAVKRHIIHRKKAARMKSQLAKTAAKSPAQATTKSTTKSAAKPAAKVVKKTAPKKPAAKKTAQSQYETLKDRLTILDKAIPPTPKFEEALLIIEKVASESQLTIISLEAKEVPKEPTTDVSFTQKSRVSRPIALTVTGDYPAVRQLIENLQNTQRTLIIDTVVFTVIEQRGRKVLQATITINVPYFAVDQTIAGTPPTPEGAPAAKP